MFWTSKLVLYESPSGEPSSTATAPTRIPAPMLIELFGPTSIVAPAMARGLAVPMANASKVSLLRNVRRAGKVRQVWVVSGALDILCFLLVDAESAVEVSI